MRNQIIFEKSYDLLRKESDKGLEKLRQINKDLDKADTDCRLNIKELTSLSDEIKKIKEELKQLYFNFNKKSNELKDRNSQIKEELNSLKNQMNIL